MHVPRVRVTSQINCDNVTMLSQKRPSSATMAKWAIVCSEMVCSRHKIACKNKIIHSLPWITIFWSLVRWFSRVTKSRVKNHWQITSLVTKNSLFTVTHALFFILCSFIWIWNYTTDSTKKPPIKWTIMSSDNKSFDIAFETLHTVWRFDGQLVKTHLPQVPHICASESGQHWFR